MFESEGQLTSWFAIAVIMLTSSLLLFNITKNNTLSMHPYTAAAIVSIFIILDICMTLTALIPYNLRRKEIFKEEEKLSNIPGFNVKYEKIYTKVYTVAISIFIIIQLIICYFIIKDSLKIAKKYKVKNGGKLSSLFN